MADIERVFVHPNVDVNLIINPNKNIRTLNSAEWDYGIQRLNTHPELNAACVLWRNFDPKMVESYWVFRSNDGPVIRVYNNNEVVYQRPF